MRVIAYNIQDREKELLTIANSKTHDFTFISNPLTMETVHYVKGKEVILVSDRDTLNDALVKELNRLGVKSIITRSRGTDHIDLDCAGMLKMHVANTPFEDQSEEGIAKQTIQNLNNWMVGGCAGMACQCRMDCANKPVEEKKYGKS